MPQAPRLRIRDIDWLVVSSVDLNVAFGRNRIITFSSLLYTPRIYIAMKRIYCIESETGDIDF